MHFILSGPHTSLHICNHIHYKNLHHNFPKMRGGVKGRLEFFQKIIRFGSGILPLVQSMPFLVNSETWSDRKLETYNIGCYMSLHRRGLHSRSVDLDNSICIACDRERIKNLPGARASRQGRPQRIRRERGSGSGGGLLGALPGIFANGLRSRLSQT